METNLISEAEVNLLLDDLLTIYGYDFTNYAKASMSRRPSARLGRLEEKRITPATRPSRIAFTRGVGTVVPEKPATMRWPESWVAGSVLATNGHIHDLMLEVIVGFHARGRAGERGA